MNLKAAISISTRNTSNENIISKEKRFFSRTQALKSDVIFVYCPEDNEKTIQQLFASYNFRVVINNYSVESFDGKVICHYQSALLDDVQRSFLIEATETGAWVEPLVSYLDSRIGYTEVSLLHSSYFLHQKAFSILSNRRSQIIKRSVDIVVGSLLSVLALPICIVVAVLIKLESPGSIFFKQKRTGLFNDQFYVVKFRSMHADAEKNGAKWASKNDNRVTRIGKFIRKTRIDELPQLINVFKGEMSIIGPRPEREVFISDLEKVIPYYRFRHAVKPGITGLAQVSYPYGASVDDAIWKHKYDIHYIKHNNLMMDIRVLVKTVKVVLFGMGR